MIAIKALRSGSDLSGLWDIRLTLPDPQEFVCNAWLGVTEDSAVHFADHTSSQRTISLPGTAQQIISVGAFSTRGQHRIFRSEGPTRDRRCKPDVFIESEHPTSYTAAMVTGMLANLIAVETYSKHTETELLAAIAGSRKEVFLPSNMCPHRKPSSDSGSSDF